MKINYNYMLFVHCAHTACREFSSSLNYIDYTFYV